MKKKLKNTSKKQLITTNAKIQLMNKLITVTAQIGKCIYKVEMEQKETLADIISEVAAVLEVSENSIKILNY